MKLLEKIFGSYSKKEISRIIPTVDKIISLSESMSKLSDSELQNKTNEFIERLEKGETLDDILVEAFAVVSEASSRVLNMKPFRVQLIGGIILHQGRIAEMKTGEGKTLVATFPIYLNALTKKGVHLVTVNDYLAKTQSIWMGKLYKFLGLSVGLVIADMLPEEKKKAYSCDVTYGTNNEFGFDYLRDNMSMSVNTMVQRDLYYAIVDEIDSILVDEARTPLIISGMINKKSDIYEKANKFAKNLKAKTIIEKDNKVYDESDNDFDYIVDLKAKSVALTDSGVKKAEQYFSITSLSDVENLSISHHINQAIRSYGLMKNDIDYIVKDGEVIIVDEFTGRLMNGRRYSDGLHQAIEAKEGVKIAFESQTLATVTFQNFFRLYSKLAGMTGTAKTEEDEFKGIYSLDVVEVPTNKDVNRVDFNDSVYKTQNGKYNAIVEDVKKSYEMGQPVLVGTVSIDKSEIISSLLKKQKIPHQVLNAKYHEKEAEIVAQAGRYKAITIATNMAGRGTDILLGGNLEYIIKSELNKEGFSKEIIEMAITPIIYDNEEVKKAKIKMKEIEDKYKPEIEEGKKKVIEAGGLKIIGSERHESRRIDNQLRGRSGRQGDIGGSKFYISFEDDLMKLFGSDKVNALATMVGLPEDMPIEMGILTSTIEKAQKRIEGINYSTRKNVLEYDDVMNKQREIIYGQRRDVLKTDDIKTMVISMMRSKVRDIVDIYFANSDGIDDVDYFAVNIILNNIFNIDNLILKEDIKSFEEEEIFNIIVSKIEKEYLDKHKNAKANNSEEILQGLEKHLILTVVDEKWMDHIDNISGLKDGIGLRAYGQTNPIEAYKMESFTMFEEMANSIKEDSTKAVFSIKENVNNINISKQDNLSKITGYENPELNVSNKSNVVTNKEVRKEPIKVDKVIGRNEQCSCGSGNKYKYCCGKEIK
ncbi:MAG: preprotein translocase subunit SecA [Clostridia bacterium]|nr:preprotein translocase subunit SecA [Clostridia bacterium]MDD4386452.1 preprotein translocase subunit SecA [Clostridia bacterium]